MNKKYEIIEKKAEILDLMVRRGKDQERIALLSQEIELKEASRTDRKKSLLEPKELNKSRPSPESKKHGKQRINKGYR